METDLEKVYAQIFLFLQNKKPAENGFCVKPVGLTSEGYKAERDMGLTCWMSLFSQRQDLRVNYGIKSKSFQS